MSVVGKSNSDVLAHYQLFSFKARCAIAITTEITREAQRRHDLDPLTTIAFGRAVSCAALLGSTLKGIGEYVNLSFDGNGLIGKVIAECNGLGHCRGYVTVPRVADVLQAGEPVLESVGEALGREGVLRVTRALSSEKSPYVAISQFMDGEMASDIAKYLTESEQIPSAVAAGVKLSSNGEVLAAGGVLVQRLGGAELPESYLTSLEQKMAAELHLSDRIARGESVEQIAQFLDNTGDKSGLLTSRPLIFKCNCNRDKMARALYALGEQEIHDIEAETGTLEVKCHFCSNVQNFKKEELLRH